MKSRNKYIQELKNQKLCPLPIGILFCPKIKLLGDTRMKYFIDRFIHAHERSLNQHEGKYTFDVFGERKFYETYHSKKFITKIIREGVRLGLIINLLKINENNWFAEFNLSYVFRNKQDKYEYDYSKVDKSIQKSIDMLE